MYDWMTREEAITRFGLDKVVEVEKKEAEFFHTEADGDARWEASVDVPGTDRELIAVYYQPGDIGIIDDDLNIAAAEQEIQDADWTVHHYEFK